MLPLLAAGALRAAPYILNALGGIFGKKKKYIDPEELHQKYGPAAIASNAQQLTNFIINSPYGQQLLAQSAEAGQGLQTEMASRAAQAGTDPSSGAETGTGTFATSAATQAQTGLERQTKANIWQAALPQAADQVAAEREQYLANEAGRNAEVSPFQKIAAAAGAMSAGGQLFGKKPRVPGERSGYVGPFSPAYYAGRNSAR